MKTCDRCGMRFADVLKALDHQRNFVHTYKKMDPKKKAAIVAKVEIDLGIENFIIPTPAAKLSPKDVPAAFCLPAENVCLWEKHEMGICGPCAVRKEYLAKVTVA